MRTAFGSLTRTSTTGQLNPMQFGAFIRMITGTHNLFEEMKLFHKYVMIAAFIHAASRSRFSSFDRFAFFPRTGSTLRTTERSPSRTSWTATGYSRVSWASTTGWVVASGSWPRAPAWCCKVIPPNPTHDCFLVLVPSGSEHNVVLKCCVLPENCALSVRLLFCPLPSRHAGQPRALLGSRGRGMSFGASAHVAEKYECLYTKRKKKRNREKMLSRPTERFILTVDFSATACFALPEQIKLIPAQQIVRGGNSKSTRRDSTHFAFGAKYRNQR